MKSTAMLFVLALIATVVAAAIWAATEFHWYTKYRVVEEVVVETPEEEFDPFADLQEDGEQRIETIASDEFHLGLLPTPQGIFDKHTLSVTTIAAPFWLLAVGYWFFNRKRQS